MIWNVQYLTGQTTEFLKLKKKKNYKKKNNEGKAYRLRDRRHISRIECVNLV